MPVRRHPVVYSVLGAPFGASGGFVGVALVFLATGSGLSIEQSAVLVAVNMFPQVLKALWAPVSDICLSRRRWYLIGTLTCAAGMFACTVVHLNPSTFHLMLGLVLLMSIASTFLAFAVEAMIAHLTAPADLGRASGWYQAGYFGGNGIGGGIGLWLLTHLAARWETGLILAALMGVCAGALFFLPDVPAESAGGGVGAAVQGVVLDFWSVIRSRVGILCALLCFLPVGTGAASSVLTMGSVAARWKVDADDVSMIQGFIGGVLSMGGCILGGYGCTRWGPRNAYVAYGALMALTTVAMAASPFTRDAYIVGNLVYSLVTGMCYAAFSAFVLEAIGAGNAATKYNAFASISNFPIWYMGLVLGWAEIRLGPSGMLECESLFGVVGIAVFFAVVALPVRKAVVAS
jgi:MFS family permease